MTFSQLVDYPVQIQLPVAWGEMDAFEHVNNVVYFRYFESARIAYFDQINYSKLMKDEGKGPILASTSCRFRKPLRYPDQLTIGARVSELADDRFTMQYRICSHTLQGVAADGEGLVVSYDYRANAKTRIPASIRDAIMALEKS